MGCRPKASRLVFQSQPAALPAMSKFTEVKRSGQLIFAVLPAISIHHLVLDGHLSTFYSLPIFDELAPSAIPIAVLERTPCAATYCPSHFIQSPELTGQARNPASPDGGQHTT
jgi:hypothetical protein